jgi:uncharacterized protein (DUF58 family)
VRLGPDRRLVGAAAAWTVAATAVVVWPALWPALAGGLGLLGALAAWDLVLLRRRPPPRLERHLPGRAFVGRPAEIGLTVRNAAREPALVEVMDEVPSDLAAEEPRFVGVLVPPGATVNLRYPIRPSARGDRRLGPSIALEASPLGLLRRRTIAEADAVLPVYPDATRYLRPEALVPRRVLAAIGVRPSRRRGEGMEFESLRDYVPGDDPRRVDWAATARRGRPVTRLYQHERNHTVLIALDTSRLMGGRIGARTKLDHAVDGALALAYAALTAGDRVGMVVFDREVRGHLRPRAHRRALGLFVELLRGTEPHLVEADYRALVREVTARQRRRALVVVLTDFVEADAASLVAPLVLLARRHRVLLVAVRDRAYEALAPGAEVGADGPLDLYRRIVLDELARERDAALGRLRRGGLETVDLVPEAITAQVLNRYLAIRHGTEP